MKARVRARIGRPLAAAPVLLVMALAFSRLGCGGDDSAGSDAGMDVTVVAVDVCSEFTDAGLPCPTPSPTRCFPLCDMGGCFCRATAAGPVWVCQTDLSCVPDCAPVDDACTPAASDDATSPDEAAPSNDGGGKTEDDEDAVADAALDADAGDAMEGAADADAGDADGETAADADGDALLE